MQSDSQSIASKAMFWAGWVLTVLVGAAMTMSAVMKFNMPAEAKANLEHLGWKEEQMFNLGVVELTCAAIYVFPPTSVLGAVLLTGYLGGAVATHVRIQDSFAPPIIIGVMAWLGLFLRDARLRALLPWKK